MRVVSFQAVCFILVMTCLQRACVYDFPPCVVPDTRNAASNIEHEDRFTINLAARCSVAALQRNELPLKSQAFDRLQST